MDTFGRLPNEVNDYIKSLYNAPMMTLEHSGPDCYLCITYPTNAFKILIHKRRFNDGFNLTNLEQFIENRTKYIYRYDNNLIIDINTDIHITIDKVNHIILSIEYLDQLMEIFTQYYNLIKT